MNLANLALCGFSFFSGFYSKDFFLEVADVNPMNLVSFILYVLSTSLTVCYTSRLISCWISGFFTLLSYSNIRDERVVITNPLLGLRVGAITTGSILYR